MTLSEWKDKNLTKKMYAHFDKRVTINDAWDYICNPEIVAKHGFYPFIHYIQEFNKYSQATGIKPKKREICYSAHLDRCIYQYYSFLLNEKYNIRVNRDGLNTVAVAYRNNLGYNNIDFSKLAFDFIKKFKSCYIMVGDFTSFFDNLDHQYLKKRLCDLLEVDILPPDYYAVYKNITRYAKWELSDLLKLNGLSNSKADRHKLNSKESILTLEQFKKNKKQYVSKHSEPYGIPQGSAISAVLANIYMLNADKDINEYIHKCNGMYMRYSDDFIVIIPTAQEQFKCHYEWIMSYLKTLSGIELSPEKTKLFKYDSYNISCCNTELGITAGNEKNILNFLGFSFDGKEITIRDKTISKYYYKMYRKARTISKKKLITNKGNRISCKNLYEKHSIKGAKDNRGNFLTYVYHANKAYQHGEPIGRATKNHMAKIRKALNE